MSKIWINGTGKGETQIEIFADIYTKAGGIIILAKFAHLGIIDTGASQYIRSNIYWLFSLNIGQTCEFSVIRNKTRLLMGPMIPNGQFIIISRKFTINIETPIERFSTIKTEFSKGNGELCRPSLVIYIDVPFPYSIPVEICIVIIETS